MRNMLADGALGSPASNQMSHCRIDRLFHGHPLDDRAPRNSAADTCLGYLGPVLFVEFAYFGGPREIGKLCDAAPSRTFRPVDR